MTHSVGIIRKVEPLLRSSIAITQLPQPSGVSINLPPSTSPPLNHPSSMAAGCNQISRTYWLVSVQLHNTLTLGRSIIVNSHFARSSPFQPCCQSFCPTATVGTRKTPMCSQPGWQIRPRRVAIHPVIQPKSHRAIRWMKPQRVAVSRGMPERRRKQTGLLDHRQSFYLQLNTRLQREISSSKLVSSQFTKSQQSRCL
jgi:hypothetical protein